MGLIAGGVDYRWGLLSMQMPGRVGYQCSNYYRKLVQDGALKDPNYVIEEGKLKFLRSADKEALLGNAASRPKKKKQAKVRSALPTMANAPQRHRGDVIRARDVDSEASAHDSDQEVEMDEHDVDRVRRAASARPEDLVLGDMKDAMTMLPMLEPAVSPLGHVLDYPTWLRVLKTAPINTCPFTKQRLTRRNLVKLTKENIDEFRGKIIKADKV